MPIKKLETAPGRSTSRVVHRMRITLGAEIHGALASSTSLCSMSSLSLVGASWGHNRHNREFDRFKDQARESKKQENRPIFLSTWQNNANG